MIEGERDLDGRRLGRDDPFPFRCHPGLDCFNTCCRDKRLTLLPYDALRLARRLGCATDAFLERHAELEIEPSSGWPTLRVRLAADGRCPFVGEAGCGVYADRPTCCRVYPLARAVRLEGGEAAELFVAERDTRCLGFGGPAARTVGSWVRDQGLDPYHAANGRAARLFLDARRPRPLALSPAGIHAVVLALYNMDVFRAHARRAGFAATSGLDEARVTEALATDEGVLALGQEWLARRLFG